MFLTLLFDDAVVTPAQLRDRALRAAAGFAACGVGEGDVIAVMLRNEPAAVEAILAARHAGAYWCGLNWHFKAAEARWVLEDSGAKLLVVHADLLAQIADGIPAGVKVLAVRPRPLTVRQYKLQPETALPQGVQMWDAWLQGFAPAQGEMKRARGFMPYTSGTTGRPKGVKRAPSDAALAAATAAIGRAVFGIGPDARALLCAPLYHSAPASYINFCAQAGATLRLEPRFDAQRLLELVERDRSTHLYLVPTMYQRLLRLPDAQRAAHDIGSVRFVASTGSPCPPQVKKAMIDWWGPVINEAYASSETGYVTFIGSGEWLAHPGSVGRAVGGALLKILDDDGNEVPAGTTGLIYARQPAYPDFVYANDTSGARAAMERDGLVTLGDMGYLDAEGYLYICDRKSDMVISGGVNIYPAEIEAALSMLPGVADCAVFGIPDEEWGEALAAAVQPRPGAVLSQDDVKAFLREHLAGYKVPKLVEFHAQLPREDTGKIFKRKLRAPHWEKAGRAI
ncbi:MAG: AMP-binding protein [Pseudomonadota bacterium]